MTSVLRHRGPDDEGFFVSESEDGAAVGLGFRRLSIIDLEHRQPADRATRTARFSSSSTARSTTSGSCVSELEAPGPPLRDERRHRGDRPPLRGPGPRAASSSSTACSRFAMWDARSARAPPRARPLRQEAALLRRQSEASSSSARSSRRCSSTRGAPTGSTSTASRATSRSSTCRRPDPIFEGVQQAARRPPPSLARRSLHRRAVLGPRVRTNRREADERRRLRRGVPRSLRARRCAGVW